MWWDLSHRFMVRVGSHKSGLTQSHICQTLMGQQQQIGDYLRLVSTPSAPSHQHTLTWCRPYNLSPGHQATAMHGHPFLTHLILNISYVDGLLHGTLPTPLPREIPHSPAPTDPAPNICQDHSSYVICRGEEGGRSDSLVLQDWENMGQGLAVLLDYITRASLPLRGRVAKHSIRLRGVLTVP